MIVKFKQFAVAVAAAVALAFGGAVVAPNADAAVTAYGVTYDAKDPSSWSSTQFFAGHTVTGVPNRDFTLTFKTELCTVNSVGGCNWSIYGGVFEQFYKKGLNYGAQTNYVRDKLSGCRKYRTWVRITSPAAQPIDLSSVVTFCRI